MALIRMDNVGIVVEDLGGTIDFFRELGLELEGQGTIEGEWAGRVTGLGDQRVEIAMMRTPDGHGRIELSRFLSPPAVADHRNAPVNALGYLRVMFAVDDIDETLESLRKRGAQLVGEVVRYNDAYRLCYIRGPEGLLIGLAQELSRAQYEERGRPPVFSIDVHLPSLGRPTRFALERLRDAKRVYEKTTKGRARDARQELHNA